MIISVGGLQATCSGCGGAEFEAMPGNELRTESKLTCTSCGRISIYHDLLEQIGERAMKQANESLAKLKGGSNE